MSRTRSRVAAAAATLGVGASLGLAAPAMAVDRYVDDGGNDANTPCTSPAMPCETIDEANTVAGLGDVIRLGGGSYGQATLGQAPSLVEANFNPPMTAGNAVIDGGASIGLIVLPSIQPREIRGLTIRGDLDAIRASSDLGTPLNLTIAGNLFDGTGELESRVELDAPMNAMPIDVTVEDNTFTGLLVPDLNADRTAVEDTAHQSVVVDTTIRDNSFDGFTTAIRVSSTVSGATHEITGNRITRAYEDNDVAQIPAIDLGNADVLMEDNSISAGSNPASIGVRIQQGAAAPDAATMRRNAVTGFALRALDFSGLGGGNDTVAIEDSLLSSIGATAPVRSGNIDDGISMTGVTIPNPGPNVESVDASGTPLFVDSSILDQGINSISPCTITFSRGPAIGAFCDNFTTTAAPGYVNPAAGDFRLAPGSAMIDAGNPAPPASALDLFGDPRALLGTPGCTLSTGRRDIGADEFVPLTGVGCPQATPLAPAPTQPATKKKCRKKRKGKKGAAAAKRCKRKKRGK